MDTISSKKIFKYDGIVRQLILALVLCIALGIYLALTKKTENYIDYVFISLAAVSGILLVSRFVYLNSFKSEMIEIIEAKVIRTFYYRGTQRIKFNYIFQGVEYTKTNLINYTKTSKSIRKDSILIIYIKTDKPKAALIKEFYFDKETL